MKNIPVMDCGDGISRADDGCFGKGPVAKTANYAISQAETGTIFSNGGATGTVVFTLPAPKKGLWYHFEMPVAQILTIQASAGATINNSAANGTYSAAGTQALFGNVRVWCNGVRWYVMGPVGTWATT